MWQMQLLIRPDNADTDLIVALCRDRDENPAVARSIKIGPSLDFVLYTYPLPVLDNISTSSEHDG